VADVSNTFEGGTGGATITTANSGGTSGNAFQFVSATATYTTTAYRGSVAGQFASGGAATTSYCEYTTSVGAASTGSLYARVRFQLPALPSDATGVRVLVMTDSTGSFRADLRVTSTGAVSIRGPAGTALATFSDTYVAGTWWDVGMAILVFSTTVGQIQAHKYDGTGAIDQTITSAANQNTTGAGGANRCQAGMLRSIAGHTVLLDDVAWSTTDYPDMPVVSTPSVQYGPWSGGVTDDAVSVTYILDATTSARLVASTTSDLATAPVYSSAAGPDGDGVVQLTVSGLDPATLYYYGVEADGDVLADGRGEVTTFPTEGAAADFSVAFGSCQFTVPSDVTFAAILAKSGVSGRALQLIHMGDLNYRDWGPGTTNADVLAQHIVSLADASMAPMLAAIPINYAWDNHDWGGDTSDASAAAGDVVAEVYRQVFPTYTLPATDGRGIYHTWVIGRVRFIQLDTRSYRDPQAQTESGPKTMLGAEQLAWVKDRLSDPEPIKIICGQYPWRDDGDGTGRWGSYSAEFTELSDYIDANVPGRVYVIFGDRHYLAADDGTGTGTRGIPQAGGAPFQQSSVAVSGDWSQGSYTIAPSVLQAYGWLDITDTGDEITIDYAGITSTDGTERVTMTTVFDLRDYTSAVVDDFADPATLATTWGWSYGGASISGGYGRVPSITDGLGGPAYAGLQTPDGKTLDDVWVEVVQVAPSNGAAFGLVGTALTYGSQTTPGLQLKIVVNSRTGQIRFENNVAYGDVGAVTDTYDPVAHRWWRLTRSGADVLYRTSPDGTTWTTQRTVTAPAWVDTDSCTVVLETAREDGTDDEALYDNVNVTVAAPVDGTASFDGTGTLAATAARTAAATAAADGTGALTGAAARTAIATATAAGTGALTGAAARTAIAATTAAGTGALTGAAVRTAAAAATAAGTGTLTAASDRTAAVAATAAGTGAASATATRAAVATTTAAAAGALEVAAAAERHQPGAAAGVGALAATASATRTGATAAAGTGTMTAAAAVTRPAAAAFAGTGALTALGSTGAEQLATAAGTGALAAAAAVDRSTTTTFGGSAAASAAAAADRPGTATLAGTGALTALGSTGAEQNATAAGTGALAAAAAVIRSATTTFGGSSAATASGTGTRPATATLAGTGAAAAAAAAVRDAAATHTAVGALDAYATTGAQQSTTAAGTGALGALAARTAAGRGTAAGTGALAAAATADRPAAAVLAGTGALAAAATVDRYATVTFAGVGGFTEPTRVPESTGTATVRTLSGAATVRTLSGTAVVRTRSGTARTR
jgi:hypothetical protein